jgi:lipid-A-disaccharide synthase
MQILVSAGEASGDRYAAGVVSALRGLLPDCEFFGCAGDRMRAEGVRPVVDAASLSVVGLVEVLHHIPRIYREYRRLAAEAERLRPAAAILTDSPDFHLPLARRLKKLGIPVFYLVAPQAWAWRAGRARTLRRNVTELHCIFPFEQEWFRNRGVPAWYIGHPLSTMVRPRFERDVFLARHRIPPARPVIALCPGSRRGEAARHLDILRQTAARIAADRAATFILAAPEGAAARWGARFFEGILESGHVRLIEGETWDAMAHADLTLAASGTVTIEAALLGAPMLTYYRVTRLSWLLGRRLVRVPFYSMVNLVAGRRVVPEFIQDAMRPSALAAESLRLLDSAAARAEMAAGLAEVRDKLATGHNPFEESARRIAASIEKGVFIKGLP